MPRAATSVATSACDLAVGERRRAHARADPASGRRGSPRCATPRCSSFLASASAPCLVRQNTIVGPAAADDLGGHADPVAAVDGPEAVRRPRVWSASREHVARRVGLVPLHEPVDRAVERGREQQRLAVRGRAVEELLHRGEEAHVGHAVGFVDHDDLDLVEIDLAALDEVGEAAGAGDEDVDAAPERLELRAEADAAVDRGDPELAAAAEPLELAADLRGELARRHEDEAAGTLRAGVADTARRAGCRRRWSCPSRSGRDRRGRGRRDRRARSWPGCRTRRRGRARGGYGRARRERRARRRWCWAWLVSLL